MTMKEKLLGLLLLAFILVGASYPTETLTSNEKKLQIEGTWELVSHYLYDGKDVTDTIMAENGFRQIKMYHKGKVMWTRFVPEVSAEWFGYGSYKTTENQLEETLEYGSSTMMQMMDTIGVFKFELKLKENSYSQITVDEKGNRVHSENYIRIN